VENGLEQIPPVTSDRDERMKRELDRANAKMRHFRAVAASIMDEALKVWAEIWQSCQDTRTPDEIIDGIDKPASAFPACDRQKLLENLYLLKHYLDYTKRLCDGSI
jgi:hypothetical protein